MKSVVSKVFLYIHYPGNISGILYGDLDGYIATAGHVLKTPHEEKSEEIGQEE